MTTPIITISREYGSAGKGIARKVAQKLQIPYYDKELIALTAQRTGFSESVVSNEQMSRSSLLVNHLFSFTQMIDVQVYMAQSEIITQLAQSPCVIVGRCADHVLQDKDIFRVFITCGMEERIQRVRNEYQRQEKDIQGLILKTDKERKAYYEYYTDKKWGDKESYDMIIDSSIGLDLCVDLIVMAARNWTKKKRQ